MEESNQHISGDLQSDGEVQKVQNNKVTRELRTQVTKIPLEGKRSYAIQVLNSKEETFLVPVIDVRDDEEARLTAEAMNKDSNRVRGSKYFKPSNSLIGRSYNEGWKYKK